MACAKVPVTIRVSYGVLKELLKLPEDVDLLGIVGIDDQDGSFPVIIETPIRHIRAANLTCEYRRVGDLTEFAGFK